MGAELERRRQKYTSVFERLQELYGRPQWREHLPPIDELVSTILSQSTSDTNRDRGFNALKQRYPTWQAVLDAPTSDVVDTIHPAGLANQKGPRIQGALRYVIAERGELNIDFLAEMPVEEALAWLVRIKGVGIKTASIVLLFSYGMPVFPVDTHVHRLARRLGLIGPKVSAQKAHELLAKAGDPDTFYAMHLNLIQHGRQVCQARRPRCERCPLQEICDYYQSLDQQSPDQPHQLD